MTKKDYLNYKFRYVKLWDFLIYTTVNKITKKNEGCEICIVYRKW